MRRLTAPAVVAGLSATALIAAGCGGSGSSPGAGGDATKSISVFGCNPERALIPADVNENCGGRVLDATVARLVHYDPKTAQPQNDIAESITTPDNTTFTVKIKKGYKFSDGTEVKAKNFVDAWNFSVANAYINTGFFEPFKGFRDVSGGRDPDGDGPQTAPPGTSKTMSGLKIVDEHTFTITTVQKISNLPVRLGYYVFAPLPDAFFADPKAFGQKPISAGPYRVDSWTKDQEIRVSKNPSYAGAFGGNVEAITFRIFPNSDAAYIELLAGNLDATDDIPSNALINEKYKQDLNGRAAQDDSGAIQSLGFAPVSVDPLYKNPKLRQAISMAIDRKTITDKVFSKARVPADGWVPPGIDGYKGGACGEYCTFDPARAKQLLAEAGGFTGKMTVAYNADASHKDWVEALCNSVKNSLSIDCVGSPVSTFATLRQKINARKLKGAFSAAWVMDYPSIENFLSPLFSTNGPANDNLYSNKAFDAKLSQAAAATTPAQANSLYQEAEVMLRNDFPVIPLWYFKVNSGWSERVDNVRATPFNRLEVAGITLK
ncbi:MAG TPA: ABC transporter substrate-binding protein [Dermatophilaceae bacterium]|nr:ABC transporter substrate-binding protein [Dermatophilaceae bacterium]